MNDAQHGFRSGFSTTTACFHLYYFVANSLDGRKFVIGLFFDLSAAFDTVNKNFLTKKLYKMGIRGNCSLLIQDYLRNRKFLVQVDGFESGTTAIKVGT